MNKLSKNQRKLFDLMPPLLTVSCKLQNAGWQIASGQLNVTGRGDFVLEDKVYVTDDQGKTLLVVGLPWQDIRAAQIVRTIASYEEQQEVLQLLKCRYYLASRDLFTDKPIFWFDETEVVMTITAQGGFSDSLRRFVAKFPDQSHELLGDLGR